MLHAKPNYNRMMQLIESVFSTRNDPEQIQVNAQQMKKLVALHPSTLTELADENGPVIWILIIPTTQLIMQQFIDKKITEKQLLDQTKPGLNLTSAYLCSATTLPEYQGKGKTKELCMKAIREIGKTYPIKTLFVWPFTKEGYKLAASVANVCGMELKVRTNS